MDPCSVHAFICKHRGDEKTPLSGSEVDPAPICVIHMREMLGRAGIFSPDVAVLNSSGKNLRRWPGAEFVILPVLTMIITYDTHTNVIPPTNYLFMKLS
jgi:hypothetical protein